MKRKCKRKDGVERKRWSVRKRWGWRKKNVRKESTKFRLNRKRVKVFASS